MITDHPTPSPTKDDCINALKEDTIILVGTSYPMTYLFAESIMLFRGLNTEIIYLMFR